MKPTILLTIACFLASPCAADLHVRFQEGAPKDRFTVTNRGLCTISSAQFTIDLSGSMGGLIFDVTKAGSGVEVFQPFEVVAGDEHLATWTALRDGDQTISMQIVDLEVNNSVAFTIDVDDTVGTRAITVSGSELQKTKVSALINTQKTSALFGSKPETMLKTGECPS